MKRKLFVLALLMAFVPHARLSAQQDSPTAAAEREQAEERHRTLTKRLDGIEESFAALQKNVTALRDEVRRLKDDLDRSKSRNEGTATQESIKYLAEKIEEVDKKRMADNEKMLKNLEKFRKSLLDSPGDSRTGPSPPSGGNPPKGGNAGGTAKTNPDGKQTGYLYKIKANDTLAGILAVLRREKGIVLTQKQMDEANPGVNWNKLKIGQEIFIPAPTQ